MLWDWLLAPIDPARPHLVFGVIAWHARVMTVAWGILVPLGILAARYFKVLPGQDWPAELDNRAWWHAHRSFQYAAGALSLVGLGLILFRAASPEAALHTRLGWLVLALAALQFLSGWLRGSKGGPPTPGDPPGMEHDGDLAGDHYDMTARRRIFERLHKSVGYLALLTAIATVLTGLWAVNAPRWMWASLAAYWAALLIAASILQTRGRAIDTYHAIWGPDPAHPGNTMPPIGIGIRRPTASTSPTKTLP